MTSADRQLLKLLGLLVAGGVAVLTLGRLGEGARPTTLAPVPPPEPGGARFTNATAASGVRFRHFAAEQLSDIRHAMGSGVCVADFNRDHQLDLFFVGPPNPDGGGSELYLNRGELRFERVPGAGGALSRLYAMGCVAGDVNGDGVLDLVVTGLGGCELYLGRGDGTFSDATAASGLTLPSETWSTAAALADADGDGDLDLYVANYVTFDAARIPADGRPVGDRDEAPAFSPFLFEGQPDRFYLNRGDGTFEDATASSGIGSDRAGKGLGVLFADLSGDEWPDVLVVNDVSRNALYLNAGGGRFVDVSAPSGLDDPRSGMGVALGDYDEDGRADLLITHWQDETNALYRSLFASTPGAGPPIFEDVTAATRMARPSLGLTGWGCAWGDVDHDGDLDALIVNGFTSPAASDLTQCVPQPALLIINEGGRFVNRAAELGLSGLAQYAARGALLADLDRDGDLDAVVTTNNAPALIWRNELASPTPWLQVELVGRPAAAAEVRVTAVGHTVLRVLPAGSSYLSCEPPIAHMALPGATIATVEVSWMHGERVVVQNVAVNRRIRVSPRGLERER